MGTYLSTPVTEKKSQDTENCSLNCGASSMQGWREAQEDAHNCILDFDEKSSLFAVYDGHGGAEVAQYAAENLPALVKNKFYEIGDYEKALVKAYLDFDDSLIEPSIVDKLTALRESNDDVECDDAEEEEREELSELYKEAKMPIEDIIMKYKSQIISKNIDAEAQSGSSSELLPMSKVLQSSEPESTSEDKTIDACSSSSTKTAADDDKTKSNDTNGVNETEPQGNIEKAESSSSAKVNGTLNDDGAKEQVTEDSEAECGPSSSQGQNGNGQRSVTVRLITDDPEDDGAKEQVTEDSEAECGPSSSQGQNGNGQRSVTVRLITDDPEDDDEDDDDDEDEMFEISFNTNDESNSEDSDIDEDDDEEDEDDDSILEDYGDSDDEDKAGKDSGCTAVMALLVKNKLFVANAGDSRCVVSIDGKAHDMSKDHKPEDEPELQRITAAGGRVSSDGRVNGGLNLSRALGDHNYKKNAELQNTEQMITALPDVSVLEIKPENDVFLVLACDGIWNSLTSQEVVDFVSERINKPDIKLSTICEELFDKCLAPNTLSDGTGCDNMTCIIVKLKRNQKRSRTDDEEEEDKSDEGAECKKIKLDSTELESKQ